jgi:CoA:oxalate CoA-transferase
LRIESKRMIRPLDGLLVLELGDGISAAYCAFLMATLGANVIKVEAPGGDSTRRMGPFPGDIIDKEKSGLFLHLNRNKRSVTIDIECATGREIVSSLAQQANVVLENFYPGYLQNLGLGYDSLSAQNSALVMTSITPFGQNGPYREFKATEITLIALGGLMNLIGDIRREPLKLGGEPMLFAGGLFGFASTMVAVQLADVSGVGQHVDVSIFEALAASHFQDLCDYEYHGVVRRRGELRTPIPCEDGFVSFAVQANQYSDLRRLVLGQDAAVVDAADSERLRREGELDEAILLWCASKTKTEAYRLGQEAHLPAAYLADARDVMESPQLAAREFFVKVPHPKAGTLTYTGFPAKISGCEWTYSPAPLLGEHTDQVLREMVGLSEDEIAEIRAAGVI